MDNVASEVSKKVKCAIKAKLTELGAYVDDELPDYIMVLVANRKTKDQMDDDLSLFLGHNTERFTSWLHTVLQKLNAAAVLQLTKNEEEKKDEPSPVIHHSPPPPPPPEEKRETKEPKKKKEKSSKKKDKKEKKKKKDKKEKKSKSHDHKEKENKEKPSTPPLEDFKFHVINEKVVAKLAKEEESNSGKHNGESQAKAVPLQTSGLKRKISSAEIFKSEVGEIDPDEDEIEEGEEDEESTDVVDLRPDADDLALGLEEEVVPAKRLKVDNSKSRKVEEVPKVSKKLKITSATKKPKEEAKELAYIDSKNHSPAQSVMPISKIIVPSKEAKKSTEEQSKSSVHDRLGPAIIQRRVVNVPSKPDKDSIPSRIASSALNSVKSVVISNQNSNSVEGTSKKLEARVRPLISTQIKKQPVSDHEEEEEDEEAEELPPLRIVSTISPVEPSLKRPHSDSDQSDEEPQTKKVAGLVSKVEVAPRPRRGGVQANTALILKAVADAHKSVSKLVKKPPDEREDELPTKKKEIFTKSFQERQKQRLTFPSSEVKSVKKIAITVPNAIKREEIEAMENEESNLLTEAEEKERRPFTPEVEQEEEEEEEIEYDSQEIIEEMEPESKEELNLKDNLKYLPKEPKPRIAQLRMDEIRSSNPRFIVTLDGLESERIRLKSRLSGKPYRAPSIEEEEYFEEVEEWEEEVEEIEDGSMMQHDLAPALPPQPTIIPPKHKLKTSTQLAPLDSKISERCIYWPACKEGDACQYIHPSKVCNMFPACSFGDKCIYIHPQCKFDALCAKPNCPYTHTSNKRMQSTAVPVMKPIAPIGLPISKVKCKYYPKCTDVNCPFMHPKAQQVCWYGPSCYVMGCPFIHPPSALHKSTATKMNNKLKWVAPAKSTTTTTSVSTTNSTTVSNSIGSTSTMTTTPSAASTLPANNEEVPQEKAEPEPKPTAPATS